MPARGINGGDANSSIEMGARGDAAKNDPVRPGNGVYRRPLLGKLQKAHIPSFPFLAPSLAGDGARAVETPADVPLDLMQPLHGEFIASDPVAARAFKKGELKPYLETNRLSHNRGLTPSRADTAARARWRSLVNRFTPQDKATEKGIAENSPLARMNRAAVSNSAQKTFFRERAREQGFNSIDDAEDDPEAEKTFAKEVKKHLATFKEWTRGWTKEERGYFALEMARIKARGVSLNEHQNNRELDKLREAAEKTKNAEFGQESNSLKGHLADYAADSLAYRDQLHLLTDEGIEAGVKELEYFLDPEHDADERFQSASERNKIVAEFRKTCREYNDAAHARIEPSAAQREALRETPLAHLVMPVELRGSEGANDLLSKAMEKAEYDRGWSVPRTFGGWLKGIAKDISALFGLLNPFKSNRLEDFYSRFSASYRLRIINQDALASQVQDLKRLNQKMAENWVKETYKYNPDEATRKNAHNEPLYDPQGLFAAFANFTRTEIVDAVKTQLKLAAESDLLEAREKRAKELGVALDDEAADLPDSDDFIDERYLSEVAEGIVDGIENALGDALVDQLKVRDDSQLTISANAFVEATDIQAELMCGRAWGAVDKMLHANLYSPTRKLDFDQFLHKQREHLGTIEADFTRARGGKVPAGDIDGLSGPLSLPADGERAKHLENVMAFAHNEFNAAEQAATFIEKSLGTAKTEGSILWLDSELGLDAVGAGLESGDTVEKCEADFQKRSQAIGALKEGLNQNAGTITPEVRDELDDMIGTLETRAEGQREIRLAIIGLDEKMRAATSPEDLAGLAEGFHEKVETQLKRIENVIMETDHFDVDEVIKENKALSQTTLSRLKSTQDLLRTYDAANAAAEDAINKIENGELSLEDGLNKMDGPYKVFSELNEAHQQQWRKYAGIGDKFPNAADEIAGKHAEAFMAGLKIAPEKRDLPEEALPKIELLHKAGVLNDQFAAAHRTDMLRDSDEKGVLSAKDLVKSVKKLGADEAGKAYAPKFANYLYEAAPDEEDPNKRLQLTLALLRASGASVDEIQKATRDHYRHVASMILGSNLQGTLLVAFRTVDLPLHNVKQQVEGIQKLFNTYPGIFSAGDKVKLQKAIDSLNTLISRPNEPMTEADITQAMALVERLAEINKHDKFDVKALEQQRIAKEQQRGQELKTQIAARFGLNGRGALNDANGVKEAAHLLITTPNSQDGLQDVMARSANVRGLIETQQESAALLEGAVLKPLKEFAQHIAPNAGIADVRALMEGEDFGKQAGALANLNRLLIADETVQRNIVNDNTDNAIHDANLLALTELSRQLRQFDPETMKAKGGALTNRLAMWWNEETPQDVVNDLKAKGSEKVAEKFVNVWKHLVTINALHESNELLANELLKLTEQREELLSDVQRHRSNQLAMMAVLGEFERAACGAKEFKFTPDRVDRIKKTLDDWGQPSAWATLSKTYDIDEDENIASVLDLWTNDCNRLPADIRHKADSLNGALAGFETLVKTLADSNAAMAGTHLASDQLLPLEEQQAAAEAQEKQEERFKYIHADSVLKNLLRPSEDWSAHDDWKDAPRLDVLSDQHLEAFNTAFADALADKFPENERAGALINLLNQAAEFAKGIRNAKSTSLFGVEIQEKTYKELARQSIALQDAAAKAHPAQHVVHELGATKELQEKNLLDLLSYHIAGDVHDYAKREMCWLDTDNVEATRASRETGFALPVAKNQGNQKGVFAKMKDKFIDAVTSSTNPTDPLAGDNGANTDLDAFRISGV